MRTRDCALLLHAAPQGRSVQIVVLGSRSGFRSQAKADTSTCTRLPRNGAADEAMLFVVNKMRESSSSRKRLVDEYVALMCEVLVDALRGERRAVI